MWQAQNAAKFAFHVDALNHRPDISCESEGGRPSEKSPYVYGGGANLNDTDDHHKKVDEDGQGEGFHPEVRPESVRYVAVSGILHESEDSFDK